MSLIFTFLLNIFRMGKKLFSPRNLRGPYISSLLGSITPPCYRSLSTLMTWSLYLYYFGMICMLGNISDWNSACRICPSLHPPFSVLIFPSNNAPRGIPHKRSRWTGRRSPERNTLWLYIDFLGRTWIYV